MTEAALLEKIDDLTEQVRYWRGLAQDAATNSVRAEIAASLGLTRAEAYIVAALYQARGKVVSAQRLNGEHPGTRSGEDRDSNVVQVFVARIRAKQGADFLINQRGLGYRLSPTAIDRIDRIVSEVACSTSASS